MIRFFLVFFLTFFLFSCASSFTLKDEKEDLTSQKEAKQEATLLNENEENENEEENLLEEEKENETDKETEDEKIALGLEKEDEIDKAEENIDFNQEKEVEVLEEDIFSKTEENKTSFDDKSTIDNEEKDENNKNDDEKETIEETKDNVLDKFEEDLEKSSLSEAEVAQEKEETSSKNPISQDEKEQVLEENIPSNQTEKSDNKTDDEKNSNDSQTKANDNDIEKTQTLNEIKTEPKNESTDKKEDEKAVSPIKTENKTYENPPPLIKNENTVIPKSENTETFKPETSSQAEKNVTQNDEKEEEDLEETEKVQTLPSRKVSMKNNQYLDVTYPGKGWVYLGETSGKQTMTYFGRKINGEDTLFSLKSKAEGKTTLHFYKNDPLTGKYIDDYLEVEIKGFSDTQERISAPNYAEIVNAKPTRGNSIQNQNNEVSNESKMLEDKTEQAENSNTKKESLTDTFHETSPEKLDEKIDESLPYSDYQDKDFKESEIDPETLATEELLRQARKSFEDKKYSDALSSLNLFLEKSAAGSDEALFLQAQIFESNSPERNIKQALKNYETIVECYPQSPYWKRSSERAIYLRKFYFNIY